MQYHLSFIYRSVDDPPRVPMFTGGREQVQVLTSAVADMAKAISTPHSTENVNIGPARTSVGISPGKIANLRSNYLQQLRDLHSLLESGAINDDEFQEQKAPILEQLKKLAPS